MADDRTQKGPQDSARVNVHEDYEVQYWTKKFNCSKEELAKAVKVMGTSSKSVEEYFSKK